MLGESLGQDRQLESDLDRLMKDMRTCEENFLALAGQIHGLLHPDPAHLFVHEHVTHARALAQRLRSEAVAGEAEWAGVVQRWAGREVGEDGAVLIKRVAYRLLEVFFGSVSTINNKLPQVLQDYLRLKMACQKLLVETGSRPHSLIKAVTDYEFRKLRKYVELLGEVTNQLENGDLDGFSKFEVAAFLDSRATHRQSIAQTKPSFYSTFKINKIKVREKQASKPEIVTEKLKPVPTRKIRALYDNLKDVMEINRAEFLEEASCGEVGREALLRELLTRNKANEHTIRDFHARKRRIQNKLRNSLEGESQPTEGQLPEECKAFTATRRNLLLKIKNNEKKGLPSELFRKTSKFDDVRSRLKSYNRERVLEQERAETRQNEEAVGVGVGIAELGECGSTAGVEVEERLPLLNRRAHSVDQNYKTQSEGESPQARTLSNSLKINEELRAKAKVEKLEKVEMLPAKIKLELKSFHAVTSLEVNKKLGKVGEFSKYLYF